MEDHLHHNETQAKIVLATYKHDNRQGPEGQQYQNTTTSHGTKTFSKCDLKSKDDNTTQVTRKELAPSDDRNTHVVEGFAVEECTGVKEERGEDNGVEIGQTRNGCDISFKLVQVEEPLCGILQNINIEPKSSNGKSNKNGDIPIQSVGNQFKSTVDLHSPTNAICNTVQCTNRSVAETGHDDNVSKIGNDINKFKSENVHAQTGPSSLSTNQTTFFLACQTQNLSVTLPACNTLNCDRKHTDQLATTVLSSESSYCTNYNSNSLSQSRRQSLFLKSQSLDIGQDPPSITYIEHDDHIFSQLAGFNENKQQQKLTYLHHDADEFDRICQKNGTGDEAAWAITSSSAQNSGKAIKTQSVESRPIYPNVPYSPYASPYSSPRSNRRKPPLRESRRISIEKSGSFLQLNQYKLMDQIGQGSYGLVKLAYSEEDSTHYAMKILSKRRLLRQAGLLRRGPKKGTSPLERVYHEIAVLKKLDHPNVVKLIEVLDDPLEDSLYMVFELVTKGEVLSIPTKTPLSAERAWSVFRDTLLGLEYLHYQRIIHADIKPGNLLLTECGRVKIADLGVCNEFNGEDSTMTNYTTAGTPAFRAPETLNVGQNIYCGKAADIWALGATLFALIFGNVPFVATSVPVLYDKIKNKHLSFPDNIKICPELKDCIERMLTKNPHTRITLPKLKVHPWVDLSGLHLLPSEEENCRLVQVDDNDINSVVRSIPKLDTLILIKTMLKKHSFGNPFSRGVSGRAPQRGGSRLERFVRAGRSNSAPGSYNNIDDRQLSADNILPALSEYSTSNCTNEEYQ